jgi:serine-type D-Ala-D-Ala carboxypeptidase/endopeptidase
MAVEEAAALADRALRPWVERGRAVGIIVALSRGDDARVKAIGTSGTERPLDADTIMEIGSITKPFTGTLLAEMTSRGEVRLEDPIGKYLPIPTPRRIDREITLLDLATQTSGLPRSGWILIGQSLRNRREPFARYTTADLYREISRVRIRGRIGKRFRYSNVGFGLLGHLLGLAAGSSYEELIVERVCRPLGLHDTAPELAGEASERGARGHGRGGIAVPNLQAPAFAGAGILRSTARDMLRFLRANLHPEETSLADVLRMAQGPHRSFRGGRLAIGLGWMQLQHKGRRVVWHNGGTVGFGSFAGFDPDAGASLIIPVELSPPAAHGWGGVSAPGAAGRIAGGPWRALEG